MAGSIANDPSPLTDPIRSFLTSTPRYAVIATTNVDGTPLQRVIWYLVRRDQDGDVVTVNSRRGRRWPTNLERTGAASLTVHEGEDAVALNCEVVGMYDDERAHDDIDEMARRYDPPERGNPRMSRFRQEQRVSFVLRPRRVHVHGDPR
jgi:hypothetical protein